MPYFTTFPDYEGIFSGNPYFFECLRLPFDVLECAKPAMKGNQRVLNVIYISQMYYSLYCRKIFRIRLCFPFIAWQFPENDRRSLFAYNVCRGCEPSMKEGSVFAKSDVLLFYNYRRTYKKSIKFYIRNFPFQIKDFSIVTFQNIEL